MTILPLLVLLLSSQVAHGQFACALAASDESSCVASTADGGSHCVWCQVASFGVCLTEDEAQAAEQMGGSCDRYSGDDDASSTDDKVPPPPPKDDDVSPSDDELAPDYWKCLDAKTAKDCPEDCTWCSSKAGYGLCLSGPSADTAKDSDFYTCTDKDVFEAEDPLDMTCTILYLQDPSRETCQAAVDIDGKACEYCKIPGDNYLCLSQEQADMGAALGVDCGSQKQLRSRQDPYDTSCALAFLQDPTEDGCTTAKDQDGAACEWCDLAGMTNLCLTPEQAEAGAALGITCDTTLQAKNEDPYDPSCLMAFLQDPTEDACTAAVDADGESCEFCNFAGSMDLCLTQEQAEMGQAVGLECGSDKMQPKEDPYDVSCALAFLQDPSEDGCTKAVDQEGAACEWCDWQGVGNLCLTEEQAQMGEALGISCGAVQQAAIVAKK